MQKKIRLTGLMLGLLSLPVWAYHCPGDMRKIDAALAAHPSLSVERLGEVRNLRRQGEYYHRIGDHDRSVQLLAQAMRMLNIQ